MSSPLAIPALASVRRFEAAGFRAWPAASVRYDGAWLIRLTPGHPARRLNSVNPLDPGDFDGLDGRIARAAAEFRAHGRPLTFRLSPLAPRELAPYFDAAGWRSLPPSLVMHRPLDDKLVEAAIDQIPMRDVPRFIRAALRAQGAGNLLKPGLTEIVRAIEPEAGLFAIESGGTTMSTAICVQDGDLAGLFEVATAAEVRGRGFGRRIVLSALKWARLRGARIAWLQVEADNRAARSLYESIGFRELYRYHYRQPPDAS